MSPGTAVLELEECVESHPVGTVKPQAELVDCFFCGDQISEGSAVRSHIGLSFCNQAEQDIYDRTGMTREELPSNYFE